MGVPGLVGSVARRVSPRHRRWRRLLAGLTLDPDTLPAPVEEPGEGDFVICGSPRSGTALLTAQLFQPPGVVTVMEPWDGMRLPPAALFASLRAEIGATGGLARGRLDVPALVGEGAVRWCRDGERPVPVDTASGWLLGVKWPAFWRYLDLLPRTRFLVCLRHPVEVIASYRKEGGRLGLGLEYDTPFNRAVNRELEQATADPALRRVLLYDHINRRILPHLGRPNVLAVRFERWADEPGALMDEIGRFLGAALGPGPAVVRPPGRPSLPEGELALVRERCTTAAALGYDLDHYP